MYTPTLIALTSLLFSSTLAAPTTPLTKRTTESWTVSEMKVHFMGRDTGLPGNQWPDSAKFNSTLDFTVQFPSGAAATCGASWKQPDFPTNVVSCASGDAEFTLSPLPGQAFSEGNFSLDVKRRVVDEQSGQTTTLNGAAQITNNDPSNPNSYLTCLGGAPLDGVRCSLHGPMSVRNDLVLQAVSE